MRDFLNSSAKLEFDKVKKYIQRYATSTLGKELVEEMHPSSSLDEIRSHLAVVSEMKRLLEEQEHPPLDHVPDVRISLQRTMIENFILTPDELNKMRLLLETSKRILVYFRQKKEKFPLLCAQITGLQNFQVLEYNIQQAIDENGLVKDDATRELRSIRKRIVEKKDSLRSQLENILKSLIGKEWAQEEIITTRDGRMVIPVKTEHKNRVPGFIHSTSSSGATVFIEPSETLDSNNDMRTLQFQEQREIEKILRNLTEQVREVQSALLENLSVLSVMDFIIAKAKYSIEVLGNEPIVKPRCALRIAGARHPVLLHKHKREEVVPLDVRLQDGTRTIIITGPNAGGKSVALKTIGILSLLVQSGCHIPASAESEIPLFKEIFVDIGDEQSIENDLSSFSSHLSNLKQVLENAGAESLALLDEIGSGTDPIEGSSLAAAILERLTNVASLTVATTHHGSLKSLAYEVQGIENAAMEFDQDTLRPTYRFRLGIPGSSYAIEMAERMMLPKDICARARELRGSEGNSFEKLVLELERQSQELARKLEEVGTEKIQLNSLILLYQHRTTTFEKELKSIRLKAINEAQEITSKASTVIEKAIREIKESAADKNVIKLAKEEVRSLTSKVDQFKRDLEPDEGTAQKFVSGETVKLKRTNALGRIIEIIDRTHYMVLVGEMKVKVSNTDIEPSDSPTPEAIKHLVNMDPSAVQPEIDLRGMYGEEALEAIDKFLDSAVLSGLHRVDIIHGKGTGALRKKVTEYLKKNPSVKSFRLGEWNEGGTGVTVVELA